MVLINGVKYACERCIRGHRVTTCTHTDQPLTMIKPKGRPASQCQHCREQRKIRNAHISCSCGKKGKSPGTHLASCQNNKNAHCTCCSSTGQTTTKNKVSTPTISGNIHHMTASEKAKKKSLISAANADLKRKGSMKSASSSNTSSPANPYANTFNDNINNLPATNSSTNLKTSTNNNFIIEDVMVPFEVSGGFYDLFSPSDPYLNAGDSNGNSNGNGNGNNSAPNLLDNKNIPISSSSPSPPLIHNNLTNNNEFSNDLYDSTSPHKANTSHHDYLAGLDGGSQLSPNELDLANHMFPLFPLVGAVSFEDDKSQPLLSIPLELSPSSTAPNSTLGNPVSDFPSINPHKPALHSSNSLKRTHQPKPVRPVSRSLSLSSSASNNGATHYQPIRPKRPESVLSVASNSSNRSFDITHNNHNSSFINGHIPNATNSAAFPPSTTFPQHDVNGPSNSSSVYNGNGSVVGTNDDTSSQMNHFARSGLGSSSSSTNINHPQNQNVKKEDNEMLFFDNLFSLQANHTTNVNNDTLSSSSSFVNFYPNPPHDQGNITPSNNPLENARSKDRTIGSREFDEDLEANFLSSSLALNLNNNITDVVPPTELPLEYELSIPMFIDYLLDAKNQQEYL